MTEHLYSSTFSHLPLSLVESPVHSTRVAVIGASGYAGRELASLLAKHPHVTVTGLYGGTGQGAERYDITALSAQSPSIVFLATPNEASAALVPELLAHGLRVIDLSGAFRLHDPGLYPSWYGFEHESAGLLGEAVYGLTEWCGPELREARLVANPGCYPTSILLALRPLAFVIDREQAVICDSKSGVSGAGRKADPEWSFAEVSGNFKAYGVGHHRHEPEIRQGLHLGARTSLVFVPHLLPTVRGILSTMHVAFRNPMTESQLVDIYTKSYGHSRFVKVLEPGALPELKSVVNTPDCRIGFALIEGGRRAVVVSVIDNLLKGAASQAIQNFNRMCGYGEEEGLV